MFILVSSMSSVESVDEVNALEVEAEAVVSLEDTEIDLASKCFFFINIYLI